MLICPHCGAENPEYSSFCSLCLARFTRGGEASNPAPPPAAAPVQQQAVPAQQAPPEAGRQYVSPGDYQALVREQSQVPGPNNPPQGNYGPNAGRQGQVPGPQNIPPASQQPSQPAYVSPGDYHALQGEMRQSRNPDLNRDSAYYQAALQNPSAIHAAPAPPWIARRSMSDIILLILKHSLIMFFVLIATQFLVGILAAAIGMGSIMQGSMSGVWIAFAMMVVAELAVIIWAGYRISAEAMERDRGWMYGAACVAAIIFVWQAIVSLIFKLIGFQVVLYVFEPVFLMMAIFLYIPLGALGGWIAERRYMG